MSGETVRPVDGREWWPWDYVDEVIPEGRKTPCAWITRLDDGAFCYRDQDDNSNEPTLLTEGQIVKFAARDDHPNASLTIHDDGTFQISPEPPAGATLWLADDFDFLGDSPADLVDSMKAFGGAEPSEYTVYVATWHEPASFRFTALDGSPRFVRDASAEEARHG